MALTDFYAGFPVSYSAFLPRGEAYLLNGKHLIVGNGPPRRTCMGRLACKRWVRDELWRRRMTTWH